MEKKKEWTERVAEVRERKRKNEGRNGVLPKYILMLNLPIYPPITHYLIILIRSQLTNTA